MSFLSRVSAQAQSIVAVLGNALSGFPRAAARFLSSAQAAADGRLGKLPAGRLVPLIALAVAMLVLLSVLAVGLSPGESGGEPGAAWETGIPVFPLGNVPAGRNPIPPQELFLPGEPDFLPGVLPGRERRGEWTARDAGQWWRDPLADGEEPWRAGIERTIDEIMENVP